MIESLLPDGVGSVESFGEPDPDTAALFSEEAHVIRGAVEKRRREFATVRRCARRALAALGEPPAPILPGERGAPRWPAGIVGSMTHCAGYRAAAVARGRVLASLGIDAEPHGPVPDGVVDVVALPAERRMLGDLAASEPGISWDRVLFSAKESIYKAWFPLTGAFLGFTEAHLDIDPDARTIHAHILSDVPESPRELRGRWLVDRGLIVTVVTLPPRRADRYRPESEVAWPVIRPRPDR